MSIIKNYHQDYLKSCQHPEEFWSQQASEFISWSKQWDTVLQGDFHQPQDLNWFAGGELNASFNCLDRHLEKRGNLPAIIWEGNEPNQQQTITYEELYEKVCRLANALKSLHIRKGDTICIYMPMIPEAIVAMLACARIGAVHNVVFGGFSAISLRERILNSNCRIVITADFSIRGSKTIPLKENVDQAVKDCPHVDHVIVYQHTGGKITWQQKDLDFNDIMQKTDPKCEPIAIAATDPLFILYTSGSTGKPKGIIHATGGYLVYTAMTFAKVFDYQAGDIFWCTADVGWITGHSYVVYGPLLNGATILIFEGVPNYPTYSRYWEIIDKHHVNIFYTSPTALRAIRKEGDTLVSKSRRSSLKILGTVGEPINPDVWRWYFEVVGDSRCPIIDTWWQTETGGAMIAPLTEIKYLKPGAAQWPFYGIVPEVVNHEGQKASPNQLGELVITKPWPGMMKTIFNDPERFQSYFDKFPGTYYSGDEALYDEDGNFWIKGRADDVIKVSGHRLGTEEIESAILSYPAVSEAAVVPIDDSIQGEAIYAFVILKSGQNDNSKIKEEITQTVADRIGAIAKPKYIQLVEDLPKTRSGKIMRRILRKIANGDTQNLGDLSTLTNPEVIDSLVTI